MKIAVLGASGFVGAAITRRIHEKTGTWPMAFNSKTFDLRLPDSWGGILRNFDCVVNAAAQIDGDTYDIFMTNAVHAGKLAEHLNQNKIKKLINISTGAVYGAYPIPTHPGLECHPVGDYAVSKYVGERLLMENFSGHFNTLRLYYPYGEGQQEPRLIPRLVQNIREGKPITCDERGGPFLSMSHVDDIAAVVVRDFIFEKCSTVIRNIASFNRIGVRCLAEKIAYSIRSDVNLKIIPTATDVISEPYDAFCWREFEIDLPSTCKK